MPGLIFILSNEINTDQEVTMFSTYALQKSLLLLCLFAVAVTIVSIVVDSFGIGLILTIIGSYGLYVVFADRS